MTKTEWVVGDQRMVKGKRQKAWGSEECQSIRASVLWMKQSFSKHPGLDGRVG